jgi:PmbA protein
MRAEEMTKLMLDEAVKAGASDAVATVLEVEELMLRLSNDQITVADVLKEATASVFAFDKEKKAGVSMADLGKKALQAGARKAVEIARKSPEGGSYAPLPKGPFEYSKGLLSTRALDLDAAKMVAVLQEACEAAMKEGAARSAGSLIVRNYRITNHTSGGAFGVSARSTAELSLRCFGKEGGSGHSVAIGQNEKELHPSKVGAEAGAFTRMSERAVAGEAGEYTAVLGPMVFADIASQVGRSASAFLVDAGMSFLAGKVGEKMFGERFSICEDPTLPDCYGSSPFDMEGVPRMRVPIVERGVVAGLLHNSSTAAKHKASTTASAGIVAPHAVNLDIAAGDSTIEEMIASVARGIYVTNDWYLRYQNMATGDFSAIPRDAMFLIENGRITKPLREMRISDSIPRMLSGLSMLGRERKWIKWWEVETPTHAPAAVIEKVRFTRSSG